MNALPSSFHLHDAAPRLDTPRPGDSHTLTFHRFTTHTAAFALLLVSLCGATVRAADAAQEQQRLIEILQSSNSPQEKDTACVELKKVGTSACIPAVAALLTDPQLSQSARNVLESMDAPEAGQALLRALDKTSGQLKTGIINSLGNRRETSAAGELSKALLESDPEVATAAAAALGKIGGHAAVKALTGVLSTTNAFMHNAVVDALLRAANQLVADGNRPAASSLFEQLYRSRETSGVRTAAYAGMIRAAGQGALALILKGIEGTDGPTQLAALQFARASRDPAAGQALTDLLLKVQPPVQTALIDALSQRGDMVAAPAVAKLAASRSPEVRAAALDALGVLGDADVVPLLAESAATEAGSLKAAARRALNRLNRGPVVEALVTQLKKGNSGVQAEAARALGERRDEAAVPTLLALLSATAQPPSDSARKAALQALAFLVKPVQLDSFIQLVAKASSDAARADAAQALSIAFQRIRTTEGRVATDPLINALGPGNPAPARAALLTVCSALPDAAIRTTVRAALADPEPPVRAAAIRALCDTVDPELLPDLVKTACTAPEENFRALAIAGCVRLMTQDEGAKLPNYKRVAALKAILATQLGAEQKKQVLSGLAEIPDPDALKLVEPMLTEADVRSEAATAAVKIASTLADADLATAVLKKVVASDAGAAARRAAEAALKQIDARSGYIIAWEAAGPYRQANKNYAALFDIAFPPEAPEAPGVPWRTLPPSTDTRRPWSMDLLKFFGGEQCVAYARTWIYSPREQRARLEIGSDDGAKIWLDNKLVHANNTARALQPAQDKVEVQLKQGWNPMLVKVTQNNLGWEFCIRFTQPDGSRIDGLRASLSPQD